MIHSQQSHGYYWIDGQQGIERERENAGEHEHKDKQ